MKVLQFTKEYPPNVYGGAGVHIEYLSRELSKLMEVEVRCFDELNIDLEHLKVTGFTATTKNEITVDKKIASLLKTLSTNINMNLDDVEADIIHCHTWYSHFSGILAKILYRKPLIITAHSLEPLRPWKREQLGNGYDLSSWIERTAIEMADAIVAVSEETKEDLLKYFNLDENKVKVIYNGIDLEEYAFTEKKEVLEKYGIDSSLPYVLFVGRITRQKGIIHLVNAVKYLEKDIQVVLCAGMPDTDEIAKEMKDKVDEMNQAKQRIIWIPEMLPKAEVIQLYSHATVFCCPSIYEPFGIINLEAMACNTAVVASAVGGIKEIIVQHETGILVPLEQETTAPFEPVDGERFANDLATAINRVVSDNEMRKHMELKSRERVEELFSWSSIALQTKKLYESLL